jgi:23S rRNA (uridine2552-2'-O)-methyltransferase
MARSKSSPRWLREHFQDEYVKRARQQGFRSRAVYKLMEIQERDHILKPGATVVDLGSSPGGWAQFAAQVVGPKGKIIAVDVLHMAALPGVEFIQGDFREREVSAQVLAVLQGREVDLVMSDIAPNISGIKALDQARLMEVAELVLEFARHCLKPGGDLLLKVFQGEGFEALLRELRNHFRKVMSRKPKASRSRNAELYLLARNYRL